MVAKLLVKVMTSLRRVASAPVALVAALFFVAFSIVLFPSIPSALGAALGLVTAAKLILVNLSIILTILGLAVVAVFGGYRRMVGG